MWTLLVVVMVVVMMVSTVALALALLMLVLSLVVILLASTSWLSWLSWLSRCYGFCCWSLGERVVATDPTGLEGQFGCEIKPIIK
jgi:hypothetical protein